MAKIKHIYLLGGVAAIILLTIYFLAIVPINKSFDIGNNDLYGKEFNSKRKELGIPTIGDAWFIKHATSQMHVWIPNIKTIQFPFHKEKIINFNNDGHIVSEEDLYANYSVTNNKVEYLLKLKYDFTTTTNDKEQAILVTYKKVNKYGLENLVNVIQDTIVSSQVDSILSSWRLSKKDTL